MLGLVEFQTDHETKTPPGAFLPTTCGTFYIVGETKASVFAVGLGPGSACVEPVSINQAERFFKVEGEVTAVIVDAKRTLVGEGLIWNDVPAPEFHAVNPDFCRGHVNESLYVISHIGPVGTSVGICRACIRVYGADL